MSNNDLKPSVFKIRYYLNLPRVSSWGLAGNFIESLSSALKVIQLFCARSINDEIRINKMVKVGFIL